MLNPLCLNDTRTYLKRDWIKVTDVLGSSAYRRDFGPGGGLPVAHGWSSAVRTTNLQNKWILLFN